MTRLQANYVKVLSNGYLYRVSKFVGHSKLNGVGPVDNRPCTEKLNLFVKKKKNYNNKKRRKEKRTCDM